MAKSVVVYHQPDCPPCHVLMEYLKQKGVPFVAKDVSVDEAALRELVETHGSQSTPTVVIDGQVLIGFERKKIDALLAAAER